MSEKPTSIPTSIPAAIPTLHFPPKQQIQTSQAPKPEAPPKTAAEQLREAIQAATYNASQTTTEDWESSGNWD
jgi:hypothetical protein